MLKYLETLIQPLFSGKMELGESCDYKIITSKAGGEVQVWAKYWQSQENWTHRDMALSSPLHPTDTLPPGFLTQMIKFKHFIASVIVDLGFCYLFPFPIYTPLYDRKKLLKMLAKGQRDVNREGRKKNIKKGWNVKRVAEAPRAGQWQISTWTPKPSSVILFHPPHPFLLVSVDCPVDTVISVLT